jgi:16S rRNA (cytosine967-C5)-methyltransferase
MIHAYNGSEPFSSFIKKCFSANRQLGSRDRKLISDCCYSYLRTGLLLDELDPIQRIAAALLLCHHSSQPILENLYPEWSAAVSLSVDEKAKLIGVEWDRNKIFQWKDLLSDDIEADLFIDSHFVQPDLFVRIRPGYRDIVLSKLSKHQILFELSDKDSLRFENGTKTDEILDINKEVVVQDDSSQRIADLFENLTFKPSDSFEVWDACAASGGKSIMLKDYYPKTHLTVSDKRSSVLHNLEKRFQEAGLSYEHSLTLDLSHPVTDSSIKNTYDLIIADVPCSGSGTWSRTPEWLHFFDERKIKEYTALQLNIIQHAIPFLKRGGYLLYITCSAFKEENEEQVQRICAAFGFKCITEKLIKGYEQKADTMYGALLISI